MHCIRFSSTGFKVLRAVKVPFLISILSPTDAYDFLGRAQVSAGKVRRFGVSQARLVTTTEIFCTKSYGVPGDIMSYPEGTWNTRIR